MCLCLKTCGPLVKKQALLTRRATHSLIAIVSSEDLTICGPFRRSSCSSETPFTGNALPFSTAAGSLKKHYPATLFFIASSIFFQIYQIPGIKSILTAGKDPQSYSFNH
jgi:hypothetical protein